VLKGAAYPPCGRFRELFQKQSKRRLSFRRNHHSCTTQRQANARGSRGQGFTLPCLAVFRPACPLRLNTTSSSPQ